MPTAIVQVGHPSSLDSYVHMLRAVGWRVKVPGDNLRDALKNAGLDTVISAAGMAAGWGGTLATGPHDEARVTDMRRDDVVYLDTKAHRNAEKVLARWPNLAGRILWSRINGGEPVNVRDKGEEVDPPCPVMTPDLWYGLPDKPWSDRSYACWPPFLNWDKHQLPRATTFGRPICLVHNVGGYGYGLIGDELRKSIGLFVYGGWGSPDGVVMHAALPQRLRRALCYVHLKSVDAPGYAVYEALASACPVVVPGRFIRRCMAQELLEPGVTCLTFDDEEKDFNDDDTARLAAEAAAAVERLRDPELNAAIGTAGRERMLKLMWSRNARSSTDDLSRFLRQHFGHVGGW